jgi:hypothetical protein
MSKSAKAAPTQTTEIVRQVRLTTNQRLALVQMSNDGGHGNPHWKARLDLRQLGLIEERPRFAGAERIAKEKKIADLWKHLPALVKARNQRGLERVSQELHSHYYELERTTYWLTKAAEEYLVKGRVVITR